MEAKVATIEADIAGMKRAMMLQDSWIANLTARIAKCEEMAGISVHSRVQSNQWLPVAIPAPETLKPRTMSGDTRDSVESQPSRTSGGDSIKSEPQQYILEAQLSNASAYDSVNGQLAKKRKSTSRPCTYPGGCEKLAHGPDYKFCLRHGGGYRCQVPGCARSAYSTRYCSRHGGGPRCQYPSCNKGAISNSSYCRRHGGGPRCQHPNCNEGARIGYQYCLAHGGYNPCSFPSCPCPALHTSAYCRQHTSYQKKVELLPIGALANLT